MTEKRPVEDAESDYHGYDKLPCDECGEIIYRGHTRLHTGQIVHHECADTVNDNE